MGEYRNYLLFFPSLLREHAPKSTYTVEGWKKSYEGVQTNEPIVKYLIDYLATQDESLDKIIMLCSEDVREKSVTLSDETVSSETTLQYLERNIREYIEHSDHSGLYADGNDALFAEIPADLSRQTVDEILKLLEQILQVASGEQGKKKRVFVDFTGGLRDSALALVFACRVLQAYDVQVEKILYSNFNIRKVVDCTKTYRYFDYLAAILELKYGRFGKIVDYLRQELNAEENQNIEKYLKSIEDLFANRRGNNRAAMLKNAETVQQLNESINDVSGENPVIRELAEFFEKEASVVTECKSIQLYLLETSLEYRDYLDALFLFREHIFEILLTLGVIEVGNERLKNIKNLTETVIGVYRYYGETWKPTDGQGKQTVLQVTDRFIEKLATDVTKEPKKFAEVWKERECDMPKDYGYDDQYRTNFGVGVKNLQKLYRGSIGGRMRGFLNALGKETITYAELMELLKDDEYRERFYAYLFPFQLKEKDVLVRGKTTEESNRFMYEFAKNFAFVKDVRNKVAHDSETLDNEELEEAIRLMKQVIEQIKELSGRINEEENHVQGTGNV